MRRSCVPWRQLRMNCRIHAVTRFRCEKDETCSNGMSGAKLVATDNLFVVMQQAYSDDSAHKFVCAVNVTPEPAIVLVTDY